jgi:hypothetical protein
MPDTCKVHPEFVHGSPLVAARDGREARVPLEVREELSNPSLAYSVFDPRSALRRFLARASSLRKGEAQQLDSYLHIGRFRLMQSRARRLTKESRA